MLSALIHKVRTQLFKKEWFLPSLFILMVLFVIPISFDGHLSPHLNTAHAGMGDDILDAISSGLWRILASLMSKIFAFANLIFNFSSYLFKFAADYSTRGSTYADLAFINTIWTFIRDIINSLFIFVVLFVAFKQLLTISEGFDQASVKKTLVNIIIAALLINFSLFFTKAAVDVSNFLSRALFCKMQTKDTSITPPKIECNPAEVIAKGLDVQSFLSQNDTVDTAGNNDKRMFTTLAYLGGTIALIVASVAFFAIAFIFIIRILLLIILLATSPIYFISKIINFKQASGLSSKWFDTLVGQLVFPVVLMLVLLVTAKFTSSTGFFPNKLHGGTFNAAIVGGGSGADFLVILNYAFVIFMLFFGLKMAKDASGVAGSYGSKLSSFALGTALGGTGMIGRNVFGRMGGAIGRSKWAQNLSGAQAAEGAGFAGKSAAWARRFAGDKIIRTGNAAAAGSWDVRGTRTFAETYGRAGKEFGLSTGKASEKSFAKNGRELGAYVPRGIRNRTGIELSEEGKKKDAERVAAVVAKRSYSGSAMLAQAKAELGDDFWSKDNKKTREQIIAQMKQEGEGKPEILAARLSKELGTRFKTEDEFKETRVQLAKDIKKEYKDEPGKAETALQTSLGPEFSSGKEYQAIRTEIAKEKKEKQVKDSAKDYGKATDDIAAKQKELADPATPAARLAELPKEIAQHTADKNTAEKAFTDSLKGTNPSVVADLAVDDIGKLRQQLGKAHMQAIAKKMQAGEYSDTDIAKLNALAREMLLDEKNENAALREWFTDEIDKGTEGFVVDLLPEYQAGIAALNAATSAGNMRAMLTEGEKIKKLLRGMRTEEAKKIPVGEILDPYILGHVPPRVIIEHLRDATARGDAATVAQMSKLAKDIATDPTFLSGLPKGARAKLIKALTGVN